MKYASILIALILSSCKILHKPNKTIGAQPIITVIVTYRNLDNTCSLDMRCQNKEVVDIIEVGNGKKKISADGPMVYRVATNDTSITNYAKFKSLQLHSKDTISFTTYLNVGRTRSEGKSWATVEVIVEWRKVKVCDYFKRYDNPSVPYTYAQNYHLILP